MVLDGNVYQSQKKTVERINYSEVTMKKNNNSNNNRGVLLFSFFQILRKT